MLYTMKESVLIFDAGDDVSEEDLKKQGCDIAWLLKRKAIVPVGFLEPDQRPEIGDAIDQINELQAKYEASEKRAEELTDIIAEKNKRIQFLLDAHKQGADQLRAVASRASAAESQLEALKAKAPELFAEPEPATV